MKTLRIMMVGLAMIVICGAANATGKLYNNTKDDAINTYLNAVVHGKVNGLDDAIDEDAQFNTIRGDRVNTLNKIQMVDYLKNNANVEQNCKCSESVMMDTDDKFVKKVDMQYDGFTRTDVITAERAGSGWKITKVQTSFK
ncbi:MAG: hypothetical protein ACTHJ8_20680 [Mucilaginibacter sp.]